MTTTETLTLTVCDECERTGVCKERYDDYVGRWHVCFTCEAREAAYTWDERAEAELEARYAAEDAL